MKTRLSWSKFVFNFINVKPNVQTLMSVPWELMTVWIMQPVRTLLVASLVHVHLVSVEMAEQV